MKVRGVQTVMRKKQDRLEQIWEMFTSCLVKLGLDTIYCWCHDYFKGEVVPGIYYPDGIPIFTKGCTSSWLSESRGWPLSFLVSGAQACTQYLCWGCNIAEYKGNIIWGESLLKVHLKKASSPWPSLPMRRYGAKDWVNNPLEIKGYFVQWTCGREKSTIDGVWKQKSIKMLNLGCV